MKKWQKILIIALIVGFILSTVVSSVAMMF